MSTVLEKYGITNKTVRYLLARGLFVPKKVRPVKNPIRSPSEEWFYQAADRFTPPLSVQEKKLYIQHPDKFCKELLKGVKFLIRICELLYVTSDRTQRLSPDEAIASLLVIQRVFHAALDYNYLKYDRHLEYHDYKESPVGYQWQRLRKICVQAARNAKIENTEEFAYKKMLELISGKDISRGAMKFMKENLHDKQLLKKLTRLLRIFKQFLLTQEKEAKIFYGGLPPKHRGVIETQVHYWNYLKFLIQKSPEFVKPPYKEKVRKWIDSKEVPEIIVAARALVQQDANPFILQVQVLYREELNRWVK